MMKPAEEIERRFNAIEDAYLQISKLQEAIPAYLNEESDVIVPDPQELNISHPPSAKERGCMHSLFAKKKVKDAKVEKPREEPEEPEDWDTKEEVAGRFDEQGNFIVEEAPAADEPAAADEWITVEQKTKKKKQKEKEEQVTYTAVHQQEQFKEQKPIKKTVCKEEVDSDSDGFTVVHDKKGKKNKKPLK
ncbi:hypothetical protein NEAUS04_0512 [Nematocida ausubeli]|uniref:Uncharacterized protein n=1 Tax=Nematocida ausubeli (strain ATCC PRA-371 / ERTm2) TaxID=1913371 RepID=A0A086IZ64_NEMA1|nr:uncharacterized protein NESG_02402 [Nematocida ausubeli]KAI5133665.1 hypothetical protein NEAUS06_0677 [Nematocida ausubeli]KAI5134153.1 hypothetical protein NEAUS07_0727 [Nematocida ausubeli]KAI5135711.1 hypothetical protein NEAUS06_1614 [Nematocida ausubeli]KAI5147337.1 hypothetical protein NEAUS05_0648 [Nematocida ausubeli]KAI5161422.1 hypothetical protein NEAUS04_0512 [Nematocida ausubeli]